MPGIRSRSVRSGYAKCKALRLTDQSQGAASAREVTTNNEGIFRIYTGIAGEIIRSPRQPIGFKNFIQQNIVVNVADRVGLPPISLEVGAATESITVEAQAVRLETETAERSGVITGKQMVDLGLNGRNFTGLLKTVPGVSADQGGGSATINGLRNDQNNFTVDGQTGDGYWRELPIRISHQRRRDCSKYRPAVSAEYTQRGRPNSGRNAQRNQRFSWYRLLVQTWRVHECQHVHE